MDEIKPVRNIWEIVKDLEEKYRGETKISGAGEALATLIVNFGDAGRCHPGLISNRETNLMRALVDVLQYYVKREIILKELLAKVRSSNGERPLIDKEVFIKEIEKLSEDR